MLDYEFAELKKKPWSGLNDVSEVEAIREKLRTYTGLTIKDYKIMYQDMRFKTILVEEWLQYANDVIALYETEDREEKAEILDNRLCDEGMGIYYTEVMENQGINLFEDNGAKRAYACACRKKAEYTSVLESLQTLEKELKKHLRNIDIESIVNDENLEWLDKMLSGIQREIEEELEGEG